MVISWIEGPAFKQGLVSPKIFRKLVRPMAYLLARNDPEKVHKMALEALVDGIDIVDEVSDQFDFPRLYVDLCGQKVMPFGPAAGLDKNGVALTPLSKLFGFVEWGTVFVNPRPGNKKPRLYADEENNLAYNAQGFPHDGIEVAEENAKGYRELGGTTPLITNVCGPPLDPEKEGISISKALDIAREEVRTLVTRLNPYSDGFVLNHSSPNTETLKFLKTPETSREYAEFMRGIIGKGKLLLKKESPYDDNSRERDEYLSRVGAFLEGGGDGIVAVNTYPVGRDKIPVSEWGPDVAGVSGEFLQDYRQRAIKDFREAFGNKPLVVGVGGIGPGEVWPAFEAGANVVEAYTSSMFNGFGIIPEMAREVVQKLQERGYDSLADFQRDKGFTFAA